MKTKRKQIQELQAQLEQKEKVLNTKTERIAELEKKLVEYFKLNDATPSDCKRGSWCAACEFAKHIGIRKSFGYVETFMCGKADSCQNFVQKEF